ncbi:MAG: transporter [Verrucomicrobia bacterium]|nr:transporter [Verrucomicrobiota bacterium]
MIPALSRLRLGAQGIALAALLWACFQITARAQDSYEIQVYGSETIAPGKTMLELHSNFTVDGEQRVLDGVLPSHHSLHETFEITHGFSDWFETGFYIFTSVQPGKGWEWVGSHIRPRARIPENWHWPVGVSLSTELGFQRRSFSGDTWTWELRPIIDKQIGRWYVALNPTFGKSIHGRNSNQGFEFSPSAKLSYELTPKISPGVEYYGGLGRVTRRDNFGEQQQQIFPVIDLNFSPDWEFNFGVGIGLNHSTDHLLLKMIVGRRF